MNACYAHREVGRGGDLPTLEKRHSALFIIAVTKLKRERNDRFGNSRSAHGICCSGEAAVFSSQGDETMETIWAIVCEGKIVPLEPFEAAEGARALARGCPKRLPNFGRRRANQL